MIVREFNRIDNVLYTRVTSDVENTYVRQNGSTDEPRNEVMIEGEDITTEFEEVYVEPADDEAYDEIPDIRRCTEGR